MVHLNIIEQKQPGTSFMKSFLLKYGYKIVAALMAYFAPIAPLILATMAFCVADFVTGIAAAKKTGVPIESKKMKSKVFEMFFYMVAILLSYIFYVEFKSFIDFPIYKLTAFLILSTEFWSNMENISKITNLPLLGKDKFMDYVKKFKDAANNTNTNENDSTRP